MNHHSILLMKIIIRYLDQLNYQFRESNNNSNTQSENTSSNADLNNEEKNLPQELLICSGEKN